MKQYRIIKFILQPAVENAFLHAFKNCTGKKVIVISGREELGKIRLTVKDNGSGMSEEKAAALNERITTCGEEAVELPARPSEGKNSSGIGLSNINERIKTEYGGEYGIRITSARGEGTAVEYTLPLLQWD
jgi:two-component system sensor histidine kinase YesM